MANDIYYHRALDNSLMNYIIKDFHWLIDAVISTPELDFQTGSNKNNSWFSVYRGTGRVLTINKNKTITAAPKYKNLLPVFYQNPSKTGFDKLLSLINEDTSLDRYYMDKKGEKKEGYYQNLISRRYTLFCEPNDDFIIIDKEFVLGYSSDSVKHKLIQPIIEKYNTIIQKLRDEYYFFKNAKQPGTECDFVALQKNGDIVLLELKRSKDTPKIALSPIQAGKYKDLTDEYIRRYRNDFCKDVISMVRQKKEMGIIKPKSELPQTISGIIKTAVVVGGEPTKVARERFKIVRELIGKDISLYTCDDRGSLKIIKL